MLALLAALPSSRAEDSGKKQEILFPTIAARTVDAGPFTVAAKATSGLPVSLEIIAGPAVLEKGVLRLTGEPGVVLVRATQAGDPVFAPATPVDRAFEVRPRPVAPAIVSQPAGAACEIGEPVSLSAAARGEPDPDLQWRKDGIPISGATRGTLAIAAANLSDSGYYDLVATNPSGRAESERARLTVSRRRQAISFRPAGPSAPGQQVTLSASASSGLAVTFQIVSGQGTLLGGILTSMGGTVVVQATQQGDSTFDAAPPAFQSFVFVGSSQQIP
jgi:hypothetical protein